MGGVDVGDSGGKKRATNSDINMIPFIDLLMVTIAFLLITAVWTTNNRINADAQVPGPPDPSKELTPQTPEKVLNLHILESEFNLVWKQGATVVSEVKVPKPPLDPNAKHIRYTELAKKIEAEWAQHGGHRDPSDKKVDQAIMHTDNRLPFKEIIAVLDALYSPQRDMKFPDGSTKKVPVFNMTFSVR
ncbi:MAG TPA: biopolymer transporter ExbD [Polyangiaceae bacterium]|jgi:biopolymer transport protein ExbD|nr:biopolymer transporter ExbD [Polyangiaceae bacterium]